MAISPRPGGEQEDLETLGSHALIIHTSEGHINEIRTKQARIGKHAPTLKWNARTEHKLRLLHSPSWSLSQKFGFLRQVKPLDEEVSNSSTTVAEVFCFNASCARDKAVGSERTEAEELFLEGHHRQTLFAIFRLKSTATNLRLCNDQEVGLLGKSERNINADCRGHGFDRPRQLPHTKPTLRENCEEGLGVSHQGKAFVVQLKLHPSEDRTTCLFNIKQKGEKQNTAKQEVNTKLSSTFLTGAHLEHENQEVRKVKPPYVEHAEEHN